MRIPRQFYFKVNHMEEKEQTSNSNLDNYFKFHQATEEAKDISSPNKTPNSSHNQQASGGSHPLVPRLNLPRPDPNEEWREIMAQQAEYEDVSSSEVQGEDHESSS